MTSSPYYNNHTSDFDARMLRGLVGTKITTYLDDDLLNWASPSSALSTPSALVPPLEALSLVAPPTITRTWVITKKLGERANHATKHDVQMRHGYPITVGIYMCYLEDDPTQEAFMRIYCQIPITGTEGASLDALVRHGVPASQVVCGELESFKLLMKGNCSTAPRFLGYAEAIQDEHGLLPGGYIRLIVWEKVPGVPLTKEYFWNLDISARNDIRSKFRAAYQKSVDELLNHATVFFNVKDYI